MPWRACPDLCGGSPAMGIPTAITATEAVRRPHQQRHPTCQPVAAVLRFVRLRADAPAASAGAHRHCLRQGPVHHGPAEVAENRCAGEDRREKGLVVVFLVVPPCAALRADPGQPARTSAVAGAGATSASHPHSTEPPGGIVEGELRLPVGPDPKTASASLDMRSQDNTGTRSITHEGPGSERSPFTNGKMTPSAQSVTNAGREGVLSDNTLSARKRARTRNRLKSDCAPKPMDWLR